MKLIKKLLPITAVASVAAVVTPLTVSCGKGISNNFDYIPTIAPHDAVVFTAEGGVSPIEQSTSMYFNEVLQNKDILVQDIYYSVARTEKNAKVVEERNHIIKKWNFNASVNNLKIKQSTALDDGHQVELFLVSANLKFSTNYTTYRVDTSDGYKNEITSDFDVSISIDLNYIPYQTMHDGEIGWWISPNYSDSIIDYVPEDIYLKSNGASKTKVTTKNKYGVNEENSGVDMNFAFDKYHIPSDQELSILRQFIDFNSYYLINCSINS